MASNPGLNAAFSAAFGTPLELTIYSEMYFHQNNRWPTNYEALVSFLHQSPYIRQTNGEPPLAYCHGADFTVLTNGDLQICYISAAQTNFLSTNQLVLSPVETNAMNELEIKEIKIDGGEIRFKETNSASCSQSYSCEYPTNFMAWTNLIASSNARAELGALLHANIKESVPSAFDRQICRSLSIKSKAPSIITFREVSFVFHYPTAKECIESSQEMSSLWDLIYRDGEITRTNSTYQVPVNEIGLVDPSVTNEMVEIDLLLGVAPLAKPQDVKYVRRSFRFVYNNGWKEDDSHRSQATAMSEPATNTFKSRASIAVLNERANDLSLSETDRVGAVFELFVNYAHPGQSAKQIHRVLTDTRWLKKADIRGIYVPAGGIPVEMTDDSTAFCIRFLTNSEPANEWAIYFSLSNGNSTNRCDGPRSANEAIAFLNGDMTLSGDPRLLEFALCFPGRQPGVENIERFSRPRVPVRHAVPLSLAHNVNVPERYRSGNFSKEHPGYDQGNSAIERYVNAYERGWVHCVERYTNNINFDDPAPVTGIGWIEEVDGFSAGYSNARVRTELLIQTYGKQKVSAYLQQFRPEFPDGK